MDCELREFPRCTTGDFKIELFVFELQNAEAISAASGQDIARFSVDFCMFWRDKRLDGSSLVTNHGYRPDEPL